LPEGDDHVYFEAVKDFRREDVPAMIAAVESRSEHPVGAGLIGAALAEQLDLPAVGDFASCPGYCVSGKVSGRIVAAGSGRYMHSLNVEVAPFSAEARAYGEKGMTLFYVAVDNRAAVVFAVADPVKPQAR